MTHPHLTLSPEAMQRLGGIALALAAVVLWSTVPVSTRLLVRDGGAFSVEFLSAGRLVTAAIIFIVMRALYTRRVGMPFRVPIRRQGWLFIAALGILLNYLLYGIGLRYTTVSAATVISQIHCVATVLLAALLLGERLTSRKIAGMLVATLGVFIAIAPGASPGDLLSSEYLRGNLIQFLAALAWPFYAIGQSKLLQDSGNRQALMPIFVLAGVLSLAVLPFTGPHILRPPSPLDWGMLLFLGVGSTAAAYWLFALAIQRMETSEGAMFNVLILPIALVMAYWLLHEPVTPGILASLALVVVGLILIVWRRSHSPVTRRTPSMAPPPAADTPETARSTG